MQGSIYLDDIQVEGLRDGGNANQGSWTKLANRRQQVFLERQVVRKGQLVRLEFGFPGCTNQSLRVHEDAVPSSLHP
jgi:hypothetical protein